MIQKRSVFYLIAFVAVLGAVWILGSTSQFVQDIRDFQDAEKFVEQVVIFKNHCVSSSVEYPNKETFEVALQSEVFADLRTREADVHERSDGLIWFNANDRFNIGIGNDMGIIWMDK